MKSDYRGIKRAVSFLNSSDIEELDDIIQVNIASSRDTLSAIGAYIFLEGARFPGTGQIGAPIKFNKSVVQEMMQIGLELMGAHELSYDVDWSESSDGDFHGTWEQDDINKGHWLLHLQNPVSSLGFEEVSVNELDCGEDPTLDIVDNVLILGFPKACEPTFYIDEENHLHSVLNGNDTDLGNVKGNTGDTGEQGEPGEDGTNGTNGEDGTDCDCMQGNPTTTPSGGSSTVSACNVAQNLCNWLFSKFADQRDSIQAGIVASHVLVDLVSDFIEEFAQFALVAPLVEGVADLINGMAAIGMSTVNAADTTDWRENVSCKLYCYLKDLGDGFTIDSSVVSGWLATFRSDSDNISGFFASFVEAFPPTTLQIRADVYSRITANCDLCTECTADINITYPYKGHGVLSCDSGDEVTFYFEDQGGLGWCVPEFDVNVQVEFISNTGSPVSGTTPQTLCWKDPVTLGYDNCNNNSYIDIASCRGISIWNTVTTSTVTVRLTLVP